jgi:two-component sensor histidine kinase
MIDKEINLLEELDNISKIHFLDRDEIETIMLDLAKKIIVALRIERMSVWLFNQEKTELVSIGEYDSRTNLFSKNSILRKDNYPIYFKALNANKVIYAEDIYNHPDTAEFKKNYAKSNDIYSLLDIPLRISGELIGVLCYEKVKVKKVFSQNDMSFCFSISFVMASNFETRKRRAAQHHLEIALQEKELLIREINHRVKNNLSILISLMRLTKMRVKSEESRILLSEYEQRIFSMLKIHDMLNKHNQYSEINLSDYVRELVNEFRITYPEVNHSFNVNIDYLDSLISTKQAIHVGLIISEILLNSIKYAARKTKDYKIIITFSNVGDVMQLVIGDNGSGFDFEKESAKKTLGLALIKDLGQSLNITYNFPTKNNCYYRITFNE